MRGGVFILQRFRIFHLVSAATADKFFGMLRLVVELANGQAVLPPPEQIADVLTAFGTLEPDEALAEAMLIYELGDAERLHRLISTNVG